MSQLLHYPSDWWIEEETREAIKQSSPSLKQFIADEAMNDPELNALNALIKEPAKEVFTIPLFTEPFCKLLLEKMQGMRFKPNDDEDAARQIPEVVFSEECPALHDSMMYVAKAVLNPIFMSLWGRTCHSGNVQVANYNPRKKAKGAWHHDASSDITVVIPLNTGYYTGGGTEFSGRGEIAPLPNGTALIFPSFTHMHRGLPVAEGDRYLLVFWLKGDHLG